MYSVMMQLYLLPLWHLSMTKKHASKGDSKKNIEYVKAWMAKCGAKFINI